MDSPLGRFEFLQARAQQVGFRNDGFQLDDATLEIMSFLLV
mgnify:CR=1 FL=1